MGTRINILVDARVPDPFDREAVLLQLAPSLPSTLAVRDYWNSQRTEDEPPNTDDAWTASPSPPPPREKWFFYYGPGAFFLKFGPRVANVRTGGRWRGFLSIEPLRRVHLVAFRDIARALGASRIADLADDDPIIYDLVYEGATLDECIAEMGRRWGPPEPSVDEVSPEVALRTDYGVPAVWYLESIENLIDLPEAHPARGESS